MNPTTQAEPVAELRGAVRELWRCRAKEVLVDGPAGTGKSTGALVKGYALASKYPRSRGLVVRKTRTSMTTTTLVTLDKVIPQGSPVRHGPSRDNRRTFTFPNGSSIDVGGLDNPDRIMSSDYDWIYGPEATEFTQTDYEALLSRLRNGMMPYHQIFLDCNPANEKHWLIQRARAGKMTRLISRHEDNPALHDGTTWTALGRDYLSTLDGLSGVRRARLLEGRWVSAEGVVYENWDESVHLIGRFDVPKDWRRFRSIDLGYVNPFVCQWWAMDHDDRMYLYREAYCTGLHIDKAAAMVRSESAGESYEVTLCDHDAGERAILDREGVPTYAANKDVTSGIQAVQARLRKAGDGKPRLFIMRDSLCHNPDENLKRKGLPWCTAQEVDGYVWAKARDGKAEKEEPVKKDDHGCDAMRYACTHMGGVSSGAIVSQDQGLVSLASDREEAMWKGGW